MDGLCYINLIRNNDNVNVLYAPTFRCQVCLAHLPDIMHTFGVFKAQPHLENQNSPVCCPDWFGHIF